jgi:hypothetical protein
MAGRGRERDPIRARAVQAFPDALDHLPLEAMVSAQR